VRWRRGDPSPDVIDERAGGGGLGAPFRVPVAVGGGGLGLVGVLIVLAVAFLGGSGYGVRSPFDDGTQVPGQGRGIPPEQDPERDLKDFSAYVFTRAQTAWQEAFAREGRPYRRAKLVLYRDGVSTGCGVASSSVGPFYCPADERVYLDLGFYRDMASKLGAQGDFAWAYVIAHEVGHHVQNQLGTTDQVRRLQGEQREDANDLSVRLELQADCYAGVFAHTVYSSGDLEPGDVEEAMGAAEAVGDDRLQRRAGGQVDPDSFTHGTSAQRASWFDRGRSGGRPDACDTFSD
jgi:predicted metalloprotease